jgi:hypothetical protein
MGRHPEILSEFHGFSGFPTVLKEYNTVSKEKNRGFSCGEWSSGAIDTYMDICNKNGVNHVWLTP